MADIQKINVNGESYDIDDPNDVEKEDGELADTVINYESATTPTIGSFTQFLDRFVSGTKVGAWFKNFRAGCEFLLHIGSLVNNCVSDNEALPLAAAQGKVLMDLITDANATIEENKSDLQSQITQINNDLSNINDSLNKTVIYRAKPSEANSYNSITIDLPYTFAGHFLLCTYGSRSGTHARNNQNGLVIIDTAQEGLSYEVLSSDNKLSSISMDIDNETLTFNFTETTYWQVNIIDFASIG